MSEDQWFDPSGGRAGTEDGPIAILALVDAMRPLDRQRALVLGAASHQLRTPLTSIVGFVELLADGGFGPITADQERVLETVKLSVRRLMALVDALEPDGADVATTAGAASGPPRPCG